MDKEFTPYELALDLKELNVYIECIGFYWFNGSSNIWVLETKEYESDFSNTISTPTFSQAFRWFRKKYNLLHTIHCNNKGYFATITEKVNGITPCIFSSEIFNTYEEAELECLRKLIQIVKKQK